jgi:uncharacterized protein YsxB (DUF464 family)
MSRDEEIVAFILIYIITDKSVSTGSQLNNYYGYSRNPLETRVPIETTSIQQGIDRMGIERIRMGFYSTMSCMKDMLAESKLSFRTLIGAKKDISDISFQFMAVFFAMHRLIIKELKSEYYVKKIVKALRSNGDALIHINKAKSNTLKSKSDMVYGLIEGAFKNNGTEDPAVDDWSMKCINIINRSRTEQVMYDFKIGFVELKTTKIDEKVVEKVMKTLTAINNVGPNKIGYVIIGVADDEKHAKAFQKEYGDSYFMEGNFAIIGVEHDAKAVGMNLDRYTHSVKECINNMEGLTDEYKQHILTNMKTPLLYNHQLIIFKTEFGKPVAFGNDFYLREFSDVRKLNAEETTILFENYYHNKSLL